MTLDGKICIVTGGGSGIGRATAIQMAREGAKLVLVGRTESKVTGVAVEIESAGGTARSYGIDVADFEAVKNMVADVLDAFGRIDVLVNNAGHNSPNRRLLTSTPEDIRRVIDSNLVGTIYCTQAVVSSLSATNPGLLGGMIYGAAKAGVVNLTEFLNAEFSGGDLRASVVMPGEVDTPILEGRPVVPDAEARATMVTSEDVAEAINLIARLPQKSNIPELTIRPTVERDVSQETKFA